MMQVSFTSAIYRTAPYVIINSKQEQKFTRLSLYARGTNSTCSPTESLSLCLTLTLTPIIFTTINTIVFSSNYFIYIDMILSCGCAVSGDLLLVIIYFSCCVEICYFFLGRISIRSTVVGMQLRGEERTPEDTVSRSPPSPPLPSQKKTHRKP